MLLSFANGFDGHCVLMDEAGDSDGAGGSGVDIQAKIDEVTAGLKHNNAELKAEKTELKKQFDELKSMLDGVGGADGLKKLSEMNERFQKDEIGKLLAEGKHEEWHEQRTASLRKDFEKKLEASNKATEEAIELARTKESKLHSLLLEREVMEAAANSGVVPSAMGDVKLNASQLFSFDSDADALVQKDSEGNIVFGRDGKTPKSVSEWLEEQIDEKRHWWPSSKGGGASGSGAGGSGGINKYSDDPREYQKQRRAELSKSR